MTKRGLSTVVTTLLIILFSIIAIGIVWVIVSNIISETGEDASKGGIFIDFDIKSVKVNPGSIDVKVKRNSGSGDITGLKFLVSDGVNSQTFEEETPMDELSEKTFTLGYSGLVKEVSFAPIFKGGRIGQEVSKYEFTTKEIIENLGAVAWWRLESNTWDEIGTNGGIAIGGQWVEGKFGKAFDNFDGSNQNYIEFPASGSLKDINDDGNSHSLSCWFNANEILSPGSVGYIFFRRGHHEGLAQHDDIFKYTLWYDTPAAEEIYSDDTYTIGQWYHLVATIDETNNQAKLYVNGEQSGSTLTIAADLLDYDTIASPNTWNLIGFAGNTYVPNGIIDEPMIFNKALSEDEVKALYELDLS